MIRALELWYHDPAVTTPVLKLFAELAQNRSLFFYLHCKGLCVFLGLVMSMHLQFAFPVNAIWIYVSMYSNDSSNKVKLSNGNSLLFHLNSSTNIVENKSMLGEEPCRVKTQFRINTEFYYICKYNFICLMIIGYFLVHFVPLYPFILNWSEIIYCTILSLYDELNKIKIKLNQLIVY